MEHGDRDVPDPQFTIANMQFGQYLAHDMGSQNDKTYELKPIRKECAIVFQKPLKFKS
jgi:peroxidase